jgi:cytochrome c553
MKSTPFFVSLFLTLTLAACGQDKPAEPAAEAPADAAVSAAPPMPMDPSEGVAGHVDGVAADAAGLSGHDLYGAKCTSCHGETGEGVAGNPKLSGLSKADISARLNDYRAGKQMGAKTAIMAAMAKPLTDAEIAALADYLGE